MLYVGDDIIRGPHSEVQNDPQTVTFVGSKALYDPNAPQDFSIAPAPACALPGDPQQRSERLHTQVSLQIHIDVPPCDTPTKTGKYIIACSTCSPEHI